jgi:hypothetical protein
MKYHLTILLHLLFTASIFAQTGIGTTTPNASAKLEVYSTDKGFLPPRVALTATNAASPITNPANGLMVFNTVTAGSSPFQVVPGYYYWDDVGLKWVSLSTTVGNVQNQAVYRSSSNTNGNSVVSTWNRRFNNIASGDLTVTSNTTFALSNGIYKIEWALPYQQGSTYNLMVLQENISNSWSSFLGDNGYAAIGNGGANDWGGGTFAADVVDCSSTTRTFRLYNLDGSRSLYYGANLIITKLNPAITTSTTADNLGNHAATKNIELTGNYISNDGGNEGIKIDNAGNVGINTANPTTSLDVTGNVNVTGKINVTDPAGNVATKAAAFVARGVDVTLGNLKARFPSSGNMSIQVSTVTGTYSVYGSQVLVSGAVAYSAIDGSTPLSVTTTPTYLNSINNFNGAGNTCTWNIMDTSAGMSWRITMIIGLGYNNNFISIERLL